VTSVSGGAGLGFDESVIAAGAAEELAGPPHGSLGPVGREERISSVDVLRGFALMGILLANIVSFGMPLWDYMVPVSAPVPVFSGPHWRANTVAWFLRWVLAEGKMRALFSMLFGAGVVLLTSRAEARGGGDKVADIYTRRNMWLVAFGVIHAYFIWSGDILYSYGVTALLFLYPCRKLKAKTLFWAAGMVLALNSLLGVGQTFHNLSLRRAAAGADAVAAAHEPLTEAQKVAQKKWLEVQERLKPDAVKTQEDLTVMRSGYWSGVRYEARQVFETQTVSYYLRFADVLGMMLLGMALFRNGFLTAKKSAKTYGLVAMVGLGIAWPVIFIGVWNAWKGGFEIIQTGFWLNVPYDFGRVAGAVGYAALVLLVVKRGAWRWMTRRVAAVGQMALSNYLLTSITCKMLFVWSPLHWYGRLEYYQLYFVVAGMWVVNLVWSWLWLRYFEFGPVEWVWRSLTYWERQPMRLRVAASA
jgi:uncharacterized protein